MYLKSQLDLLPPSHQGTERRNVTKISVYPSNMHDTSMITCMIQT